ncbi:hypothetical protein JCM1393_06570 [Clostridium carnis]
MERWLLALISIGFLLIAVSASLGKGIQYILIIEGALIVLVGYFLLRKRKKNIAKEKK